jgi:hypothetical protein
MGTQRQTFVLERRRNDDRSTTQVDDALKNIQVRGSGTVLGHTLAYTKCTQAYIPPQKA